MPAVEHYISNQPRVYPGGYARSNHSEASIQPVRSRWESVYLHSVSHCAHHGHTGGQSHGAYTLTVGGVGACTEPTPRHSNITRPTKKEFVYLSPMEGEYTTHYTTVQNRTDPNSLPSVCR